VSTSLETRLTPEELLRALNGNLPRDIAVLELEPTCEDFNARRDPISKLYRFAIWSNARRSPLRARRFSFVPHALDLDAMRGAAAELVGTHDFACFQAAGSDVLHTVRKILRLEIEGESGGEVILEVEGTGFLRHMVRNIAGTLIEVGRGRRSPDSMKALLESRDRRNAGPTAGACGLTLVWVKYEA
jgi:tRNA pseudouridine38-40 synthase